MPKSAISIQNLCKNYQNLKALKGVSLEVSEGQFFGLLGPNGAGKSTLINILTGVALKSSGDVKVFGHDVESDYKITRRLIGVVPQELVYDHFFTVEETLEIISGYYGISDNKEWCSHLIHRLGLDSERDKRTFQLSGGMKRRVLIAKALVHKPKIIILDEPTAGVDVSLRHSLWEFISELHREEGTTIILTTHYLEEAEAHCDQIAILNGGEIIALEKTAELKNRISTSAFEIELASSVTKIPESIKQFNPVLQPCGHKVVMPFSNKRDNLNQILAVFLKENLQISNCRIIAPSLEEVFIHLTKNQVEPHV